MVSKYCICTDPSPHKAFASCIRMLKLSTSYLFGDDCVILVLDASVVSNHRLSKIDWNSTWHNMFLWLAVINHVNFKVHS